MIWHSKDISEIFSFFGTSPQGLDKTQLSKNKEKYGLNIIEVKKKTSRLKIFLSQFNSAFIYILMVAAIIVFALGEHVDGTIIVFIILLNAIIGAIQEGKAQDTLNALQNVIESHATVIRDGKTKVILDKDVIPGDILVLKDGDLVTADARLFESNRLQVNQSALTGETTPVIKNVVTIPDEKTQTADQNNMVFKGTYVISGLAKAVVVETGKRTTIGGIAKQLTEIEAEVPLKENIKNLSKILIIIVSVLSVLIFLVGILNGETKTNMFLTVVAVAVSAIPESLPVVVTIVLAAGVFRMSKNNALVKKLQAVEALGQAKVIALDKTGTITKNQMEVKKLYVGGRKFDVSGDGYSPEGDIILNGNKIIPSSNQSILLAGKVSAFTAIADIVFNEEKDEWERILGDPTEAALKVFAEKIGLPKEELEKENPRVFEIPFDFQTKHHASINIVDDKNLFSTAGSPEVLLDAADTFYKDGKVHKLTKEEKDKFIDQIFELSDQGYRVLGLAVNFDVKGDFKKIDPNNLSGLTFVGLVGIIDAIRAEVPAAIRNATNAGIKVVMITGDHKETAEAIANQVGIRVTKNSVLLGSEIEEMTEDELVERLDEATIFARVSPHHKLKIIKAFKKKGDIIAMTGDGINDALSLTAADLGVSMGKIGTEVAREASDIILLDDNFDNITKAIEEGRNIYQTIRKSVLYLLSTNAGELLVIALAVFMGLPLPLIASQIIWLNMVTDSFLVAALALEPKDKNLLNSKIIKPSKWFIDRLMAVRIVLIGSVMTVGTLSFFMWYLPEGMLKAWTISLTVLTVFQWFNIFNVRSHRESIFKQNPFSNKYLVIGLIVAIILHLFAVYTPFMQAILKTAPLDLNDWFMIIAFCLSIVVVEEIRKFIYRMKYSY